MNVFLFLPLFEVSCCFSRHPHHQRLKGKLLSQVYGGQGEGVETGSALNDTDQPVVAASLNCAPKCRNNKTLYDSKRVMQTGISEQVLIVKRVFKSQT